MTNVEHTSDRVAVVFCRDCRYCQLFRKRKIPGFFCERLQRNLYAPHYKDSAWYCADGERRDDNEASND